MPPLYTMDDQQDCFLDGMEEFHYCIALTVIKPDNLSSAWNLVQVFYYLPLLYADMDVLYLIFSPLL